jgi:type VI secretion system secreted protein Hcp
MVSWLATQQGKPTKKRDEGSVMAKGDIFLKMDDVKGESQDDAHKGEIDVHMWSWGAAQAGSAQTGGGVGSGKVQFADLTIVKNPDSATPVLLGMCASGQSFSKAVLVVRKAGGPKPLEYITVTMEQGIVTSLSTSVSGGDISGHTETLTFNFAKVQYDYKTQKADGSAGPTITMKWDIAANKKL